MFVIFLKQLIQTFLFSLLVFWSFVRLMLSGDIDLNPGHQLENLIEYSSYLKNRGSNHSPIFSLLKFRYWKTILKSFQNFLQKTPIITFVAVTETWLDTNCKLLTASHIFFGKCRSDKTEASKSGGVGIFAPKIFSASINSSNEMVWWELFWIHLGWNNWPTD